MKFQNLLKLFQYQVEKKKGSIAIKFKGNGLWQEISWQKWYDLSMYVARALKLFNIKRGERVAIFSRTNYQWIIAETGILLAGAIPVPVNPGISKDELSYILLTGGVKTIFVENPYVTKKLLSIMKDVDLERIIYFYDSCTVEMGETSGETLKISEIFGGEIPDNVVSFEDMLFYGEEVGKNFDQEINSVIDDITPEDELLLMFTSGTTGLPKGVILTHENIMFEIDSLSKVIPLTENDNQLIFLPLSHILGYVVYKIVLKTGNIITLVPGATHLLENIKKINPTYMVVVPAFCEKLALRIQNTINESSIIDKFLFDWAREVYQKYQKLKQENKPISLTLKAQYLVADNFLAKKIRSIFGSNLKILISGGAHLHAHIGEFFYSFGVKIIEGYGLTETTSAVTLNPPEKPRFGTVGLPIPGVEVILNERGEILVRGKNIMKGYFGSSDENEEVFTPDGFFKTGDIGEFDEEGYLIIKGKAKEIIVTSDGKNIPPVKIESMLRQSKYIKNAVVFGDNKPFLVALLNLNIPEIKEFAKKKGIHYGTEKDLIRNPYVYNLIEKEIENYNFNAPKSHRIKKFAIIYQNLVDESQDFAQKIRRNHVYSKFHALIESFYKENL